MFYKSNFLSEYLGSPSINRPKAWHKSFGDVSWLYTTLAGNMISRLDNKNKIRKWFIIFNRQNSTR